jgi:type II secretory pathway pseudopilin PulG
MPRGAAEQRIVDDAVEYSWLRDRARRAQEARLAAKIVNAGIDEANREADEVLRLGQLLFSDNRGPLANYPHYDREEDGYPESVPLVSHSDIVDDPEGPQRLVLRLRATAGGCQWMLDRWSELRSILEEGLDW